MGAQLRVYRQKIRSAQTTKKITKAMELIAASRIQKAMARVRAAAPFARAVTRAVSAVATHSNIDHPLTREPETIRRSAIVIFTSDRGLAGAFNSQIVRAANRRYEELRGEGKEVVWYASGRRGVGSLRFRGRDVEGAYEGFTDRPAFADARDIAGDLASAYVDGKVDRVEVIYNGYVSPLTQTVTNDVLLPLQAIEDLTSAEQDSEEDAAAEADSARTSWLYEPEPEEILQRLVPDYIEISIFRALLESTASEHGARMTAMRNAQENASEMIDDLTLEMNRQRQAEITQEIMEVVAGAEGLS